MFIIVYEGGSTSTLAEAVDDLELVWFVKRTYLQNIPSFVITHVTIVRIDTHDAYADAFCMQMISQDTTADARDHYINM